jgi:hypothetical protein
MPSFSRLPPFGGLSIVGAAHVAEPQDTIEAQSSDEAISGNGVPVTDTAATSNAATKAAACVGSPAPRCYQGVPLMSQPKRWPLAILLARLAHQGARLPPPKRPMMAAPWSLRSSWGTPCLGPLGTSPLMRPWVWTVGHLPSPSTCSAGRVVASSMNDGACYSGLPCSWSRPRRRGQGRRLGSSTLT